jgi:hypothetical protein
VGNIDQAFSNHLLDASVGTATLPAVVTPLHARLMTVNGSATVNGTELPTGGGYTSGTGAPTLTFAAAAGGSNASNSSVTVTNMPACTITGVELWDSAGTPGRKWWGPLSSSLVINVGDTFSIGSGALTLQYP